MKTRGSDNITEGPPRLYEPEDNTVADISKGSSEDLKTTHKDYKVTNFLLLWAGSWLVILWYLTSCVNLNPALLATVTGLMVLSFLFVDLVRD